MTTALLPLTLIAAVARNGVIGQGNRTPWRLPGDMAHFRSRTMGRPLLMGRKTFDSIGRPLPGRPTIVLSRGGATVIEGAVVVGDLHEAVRRATELGTALGAAEIMVAGGAAIYAATIAEASTMLLTEVDLAPDGDAVFPPIDRTVWRDAERIEAVRHPGDEAAYRFVRWVRRAPGVGPGPNTG